MAGARLTTEALTRLDAEPRVVDPKSIVVRSAHIGDWPAVANLLAQLGRPDVRRDAVDEAAGRRVFEEYLRLDDREAFVAEVGGEVLGFINVEFRTRLNVATPQAWIPDLVVDDRARGLGIGSRLLRRAEAVARERGCWGMALESANWRVDAHRFYESHGWSPSARAFYRALSEIDWPPKPG